MRRPPRSTRPDTLCHYTKLFRSFSEALADALLNEWAADADVLIELHGGDLCEDVAPFTVLQLTGDARFRSEEHTSELPSLMRISYVVFCLQKTIHIY